MPISPLFSHTLTTGLLVVLCGCANPLKQQSTTGVHAALINSVERELADFEHNAPTLQTTAPGADVEAQLAHRRDELEQMAGPRSYSDIATDLGPDLTGGPQQEVSLSLQQAIHSAVGNNLRTQIARLQPAIAETDIVAAQAAFDAVFFTNVSHNVVDQPSIVPVLGGISLGAPASVRNQNVFETGIRKPLISGGEITVSTRIDRSNNKTPGFASSPDPAYTSRITLGLSQPLLRGFGSDVNMAEIRLAQNADRRSIQQLHASLLALVEQTEDAYWTLVIARQGLNIRQRLLDRGIETRDFMRRRAEVRQDVRDSQLADAMATVQGREADLIRARRQVRGASDALKAIINDSGLTVGSETMLNPVDVMVETAFEFNLREILLTSLRSRPEITAELINLDDAAIGLNLADNARLPLLSLQGQIEFLGLDDSVDQSYSRNVDGSFVDYFLSLAFEQPLGNREAQAGYRRARLQQSAAVIGYQNAVQEVALDVKSALRDVVTNYELIQATRSLRVAQAENLRALLVDEEFRAVPTVEFLNLKFQRQEGLANAELQEIEALANYNKAIAGLQRAMGIGLETNRIELTLPKN